jgi:hypothetical protein
MIVFEFVMLIKKNNDIIDMSCGWCGIDVQLLQKSQVLELNLNGGAPQRLSTIHPDDVRTNRTGIRSIIKKLSKSVQSKLKVSFTHISKLPQNV